jgi:membrane associated rhomboid family serine protease
MLALFIFGSALERHVGSWEFLCYYLVTGILAGAFSILIYWLTGKYGVLLIGASGAIFAIELAYATFFPNATIYFWGLIPLRAPVMVLVFTGIELFNTITGSRDGVAHLTHLAGFAFGWFYFMIRFGFNPINSLFRRR